MHPSLLLSLVAMAMGATMSVYLPMNSSVARHLGSVPAATMVFFAIALATTVALSLFRGEHAALSKLRGVPGYLYLSGVVSAGMIIGTTFLIPQLGARKFFILLVSGQVLMAVAVSHFGVLESPRDPISMQKAIGAALVIAGVFLSTG